MELPSLPFLAAVLLLSVLVIKRALGSRNPNYKPPPGPMKLPIIGNMHNLMGKLPWRALDELAKTYGPVLHLKMGEVDFVVVSSKEAAEEVLKTQDLNFAYRPELAIAQTVGYGCTDIAFAPYGPYWKMLRKICFTEMLSIKRVRSFSRIRYTVIDTIMNEIAATPRGATVNLTNALFKLANTFISRAAFGNTCAHQEKFINVARQALVLVGGFNIGDSFPSLKFLDVITGGWAKLTGIQKELDILLNQIIKEHQTKTSKADEDEDFVDTLLRLKDSPDLEVPMTMDNVKAVILDMFIGGTETSASIVEWALSELLMNPKLMEKARKEVREAAKGRKLDENLVNEMPYLRLIIKETLRLHPPVPMLVLRAAQENCEVLGYTIKAGTRVSVNAWAMARDPKYWDAPVSFRPERFEDNDMDFKGFSFEYLPFGSGRRVCPGMTLGMATVHNVLANLLYYFDFQLPAGMRAEDLDMTETTGSNASRQTPLHVRVTPVNPLPKA